MSRKPCAGSTRLQTVSSLIKFESRLQTHRRMSEGATLHACPSSVLFPSTHFQQTSSLHGPLAELATATHVPRRGCQLWEGLLSSPPVLHLPGFPAHHPAAPCVPRMLGFHLKGSQLWRGMVCRPMSFQHGARTQRGTLQKWVCEAHPKEAVV